MLSYLYAFTTILALLAIIFSGIGHLFFLGAVAAATYYLSLSKKD